MSHYDTRSERDCTSRGLSHTWSGLKSRNRSMRPTLIDGEPHLIVKFEQYRECTTTMPYDGGPGVGEVTGEVCDVEKDVEVRRFEIPLSEFEVS